MKAIHYILVFLFLTIGINTLSATTKSADQSPMAYFHQTNYTQTIKILEERVAKEPNAIDYYNLALCYNKMGLKEKAILSIERSFYLDPYYSETRELRELLYKSVEGACSYRPSVMQGVADSLIYPMTLRSWINLAVILFILSMLALAMYFYLEEESWQRVSFYSFLVLLAFVILSNLAIAHEYYYHVQQETLLIVQDKGTVYQEAHEDAPELMSLFKGNRLKRVAEEEANAPMWQKVVLPNGQTGFVQLAIVEAVVE